MAVTIQADWPTGAVAAATGGPPMITAEGLSKRYGDVTAVDAISFTVCAGEVFSLLGHNGAGKTTTIRMLTGQARPSGGRATVASCDVVSQRDRFKPMVNLVSEDQNLYERMSGRENLEFFAQLYQAPRRRADELLDLVGLRGAARRRVKTYSSGMKQRLLIARALVNRPRVLFLDEPTSGLDPVSARDVHRIVTDLSRRGTTVFLTTHYTALVLLRSRQEQSIRLDEPDDAARLAVWMRAGEVLTIHSQEGTLEDVFVALAGRPL